MREGVGGRGGERNKESRGERDSQIERENRERGKERERGDLGKRLRDGGRSHRAGVVSDQPL